MMDRVMKLIVIISIVIIIIIFNSSKTTTFGELYNLEEYDVIKSAKLTRMPEFSLLEGTVLLH